MRQREQVAHWSGLVICGSIHACPVCAAKIRNERAQHVSLAAARHIDGGGYAELVSLTLPHDMGDALADTFDTVAEGWRHVVSRGQWAKLKRSAGVVGFVRSVEVTWGRSGWHPHIHAVLLFDRVPENLGAVRDYVRRTWHAFVVSRGFRPPHETYGVDFRPVFSAAEAGEYVAKVQDSVGADRSVGNELARGDMKGGNLGGLTPFQVLEEFVLTGDAQLLAVWHEWERVSKGRRAITWSRGLKARLLPDVDDRTDEEIAAEEVGGDDLLMLEQGCWRKVRAVPGLDAESLRAAERGGVAAVVELLAPYGVRVLPPPLVTSDNGPGCADVDTPGGHVRPRS